MGKHIGMTNNDYKIDYNPIDLHIQNGVKNKMSSYIGIVFCDNNACLENNFNEICNEPILFILVINKGGKIDIKYTNWKIDGLSERIK